MYPQPRFRGRFGIPPRFRNGGPPNFEPPMGLQFSRFDGPGMGGPFCGPPMDEFCGPGPGDGYLMPGDNGGLAFMEGRNMPPLMGGEDGGPFFPDLMMRGGKDEPNMMNSSRRKKSLLTNDDVMEPGPGQSGGPGWPPGPGPFPGSQRSMRMQAPLMDVSDAAGYGDYTNAVRPHLPQTEGASLRSFLLNAALDDEDDISGLASRLLQKIDSGKMVAISADEFADVNVQAPAADATGAGEAMDTTQQQPLKSLFDPDILQQGPTPFELMAIGRTNIAAMYPFRRRGTALLEDNEFGEDGIGWMRDDMAEPPRHIDEDPVDRLTEYQEMAIREGFLAFHKFINDYDPKYYMDDEFDENDLLKRQRKWYQVQKIKNLPDDPNWREALCSDDYWITQAGSILNQGRFVPFRIRMGRDLDTYELLQKDRFLDVPYLNPQGGYDEYGVAITKAKKIKAGSGLPEIPGGDKENPNDNSHLPQARLMHVIEENIGCPEGWLEKTYCAVCDRVLQSTLQSIQHYAGDKHNNALKKWFLDSLAYYGYLTESETQEKWVEDVIRSAIKKLKINPSAWECEVCKVPIPSEQVAQLHFSSTGHKRAQQGLPKVKWLPPDARNRYNNICVPCEMTFHSPDEIRSHISSIDHQTRLRLCAMRKIQLPPGPSSWIPKEAKKRNKATGTNVVELGGPGPDWTKKRRTDQHPGQTPQNHCAVCNKSFPTRDILEAHFSSLKHQRTETQRAHEALKFGRRPPKRGGGGRQPQRGGGEDFSGGLAAMSGGAAEFDETDFSEDPTVPGSFVSGGFLGHA